MKLGVLGGSGLYAMDGLEDVTEKTLSTPFGAPSDAYICGRLDGVDMVFLPRHGRGHRFTPSEINYRANIWGLKALGVTQVVAVSAVGSMREEIAPGDFVLIDQFIDRTRHRPDTFFGDGVVAHVMFADPVCEGVRQALVQASRTTGIKVHDGGTYLCMEGPQFSTRAESELYRSWGVDVIGMTNLTEAKLAREAELCYATLAMATDYDCWHQGHDDVTVEAIVAVMHANVSHARQVLRAVVPALAKRGDCAHQRALANAIMTDPKTIDEATRTRMDLIIGRYLGAEGLSMLRDGLRIGIRLGIFVGLLLPSACRSKGVEFPPAWELGGQTRAYHDGPLVAAGEEGPIRHLAPLIDGWKYTETLPADTPVPPQWVLQAAPAGQQIYWLAGESHPKAPSVVLHVAEKGPAWDALVQGLRAWTYAVDSLQLLPAESPIVVCQGDAHALLETIETLGPKPLAWVTVSTQPSEPTTLFRGPDPMAKPLEEGVEPPSNGLAIVLRLALVDVGLLTRPWLSLERPFDGDRAGWDLAVAGIAFAHWALGSSGLDLAKSDHPELGETARNQLGLWAAVQCLVAPSPADLNRYLDSVKLEMRLRYNQNDEAETLRWKAWLTGARLWLRKRALLLEDETR